MKLTNYTDYSLRVLMYLSVNKGELATVSEIAERHGISRNHMVKIVHHLGQLGHVKTIRGKHGGLRLGRRPEDINIGRVVRETESNMELVECFGDNSLCVHSPGCELKKALREALKAFLAVLDGYTLADLVSSPRRISRQLGLRA